MSYEGETCEGCVHFDDCEGCGVEPSVSPSWTKHEGMPSKDYCACDGFHPSLECRRVRALESIAACLSNQPILTRSM